MVIGDRLKELRESKKLSQGDIEKRTGLLRCYISRVENGHTVPSVETLEKMARALEVPMYQLFHEGEAAQSVRSWKHPKDTEWGMMGRTADYFSKLRKLLAKMDPYEQKLLMNMAQRVARHSRKTGAQLVVLPRHKGWPKYRHAQSPNARIVTLSAPTGAGIKDFSDFW